jgi:hypothetical protein
LKGKSHFTLEKMDGKITNPEEYDVLVFGSGEGGKYLGEAGQAGGRH